MTSIDKFTEQEEIAERKLDEDAGPPIGVHDPYIELPLPIKMQYNRTEYMWLSDAEKASLTARECEPEF